LSVKAPTERREIPNGANPERRESRTAPSSEERGIPESGTTKSEERRAALAGGAGAGHRAPHALVVFSSSALRDFALLGIQRSSGFRALRGFALSRSCAGDCVGMTKFDSRNHQFARDFEAGTAVANRHT
jgi:hypothetical protein